MNSTIFEEFRLKPPTLMMIEKQYKNICKYFKNIDYFAFKI
jgi:hypothetical protein